MATTLEQVAKEAMALPSESRAQLADLLVESLDGEELGRIEQMWLVEAKRRRDEVRSGTVETVTGEEALRSVRDSLGG
jgi:hypothetical protein